MSLLISEGANPAPHSLLSEYIDWHQHKSAQTIITFLAQLDQENNALMCLTSKTLDNNTWESLDLMRFFLNESLCSEATAARLVTRFATWQRKVYGKPDWRCSVLNAYLLSQGVVASFEEADVLY